MSYAQLKGRFTKIYQLGGASSVLYWDSQVMMPRGGADARGDIMGLIDSLQNDMRADPVLQDWVAAAKTEKLTALEKRNLELMEREILLAQSVPTPLLAALSKAQVVGEGVWRDAKKNDDWQTFKPYLEDILRLQRERAAYYGEALKCSPYDAMMTMYQADVNQAVVDPLFAELGKVLPDLANEVIARQGKDKPKPYPMALDEQRVLAKKLMAVMGFDFNRGRVDEAAHPFNCGIPSDTRLTTAYNLDNFFHGLMGIAHETGHALYQLHLPEAHDWQPLGWDAGMAVHESQSLLMEMHVARTKAFCTMMAGLVGELGHKVSADDLQKSVLWVERSYIRTKADEVTYPLHVMLRYDLEKDLFNGKLAVADIPEAWEAKSLQYLGLPIEGKHSRGCMQDIHWSAGLMGYFPHYTMGALLSAQLMESVRTALPALDKDIETGDLGALRAWLTEKVWGQGQIQPYGELVKGATGKALSVEPYLKHVKKRYLGQ